MDIFLLLVIGITLLGFIIFGLLILMTGLLTGVPYVPTSKKIVRAMIETANLNPNQKVYDLGSGNGAILFAVPKNTHRIGYEKMTLLHLWAKARNWIRRDSIVFKKQDLYTADLSDADVIFCYLFPFLMERFENEIWPTLKPGCQVVSHGFKLQKQKEKHQQKVGKARVLYYVK